MKRFIVLILVIFLSAMTAFASETPDLDLSGPQFLPEAQHQSRDRKFIFFVPMTACQFAKLALFEIYFARTDVFECENQVLHDAVKVFGVSPSQADSAIGPVLIGLFRVARKVGWTECQVFWKLQQQKVPVEVAWHLAQRELKRTFGPVMVKGDDICFNNPYILCGNKAQEDLYLWIKMQEARTQTSSSKSQPALKGSTKQHPDQSKGSWTLITPNGKIYNGLHEYKVNGGTVFFNPATGSYIYIQVK